MKLNMDVFKDRVNQIFKNETQEVIANKLNMTQGNVSKIMSGAQQPTIDTVFNIAEIYGVSVDWLLGRTDEKKIVNIKSYAVVIENLIELEKREVFSIKEEKRGDLLVNITDPMIKKFFKKGRNILIADENLYNDWKNKFSSLFEDKLVIGRMGWWNSEDVENCISHATTDEDWRAVHKVATLNEELQKDYQEYKRMQMEEEAKYIDEYGY